MNLANGDRTDLSFLGEDPFGVWHLVPFVVGNRASDFLHGGLVLEVSFKEDRLEVGVVGGFFPHPAKHEEKNAENRWNWASLHHLTSGNSPDGRFCLADGNGVFGFAPQFVLSLGGFFVFFPFSKALLV